MRWMSLAIRNCGNQAARNWRQSEGRAFRVASSAKCEVRVARPDSLAFKIRAEVTSLAARLTRYTVLTGFAPDQVDSALYTVFGAALAMGTAEITERSGAYRRCVATVLRRPGCVRPPRTCATSSARVSIVGAERCGERGHDVKYVSVGDVCRGRRTSTFLGSLADGFLVEPVGQIRYQCMATPKFVSKNFANGVTLAGALNKSTAVLFNRKDALHDAFLESRFGVSGGASTSSIISHHRLRCSMRYWTTSGMAWCRRCKPSH